jgi:hypothetical protein
LKTQKWEYKNVIFVLVQSIPAMVWHLSETIAKSLNFVVQNVINILNQNITLENYDGQNPIVNYTTNSSQMIQFLISSTKLTNHKSTIEQSIPTQFKPWKKSPTFEKQDKIDSGLIKLNYLNFKKYITSINNYLNIKILSQILIFDNLSRKNKNKILYSRNKRNLVIKVKEDCLLSMFNDL